MESFPHSSPSPSPSPSPPPSGAAATSAAMTTDVEAFPRPQQQVPTQVLSPDAPRDAGVFAAANPMATTRDRSQSTPPSNLLSSLAASLASSPSPVVPTSSPVPIPSPASTLVHAQSQSYSQRPNTTGTSTVFTSLDDDHPTSLAAIAAHKRKSRSIGNIHALHSVSENVVSVSPTNDNDALGRRRSSVASNVSSNAQSGATGAASAQTCGTLPPPVPPISLPTAYSNTLPRSPSDGLRNSSTRPNSVVMGTTDAASHGPATPEHHVSLSPEEPPKQLSSDDAPEVAATSAAVPSVSIADTQESSRSQAAAQDGAHDKGGDDTEDVGASTTNIHQATSSQQEPHTHSTSGTLAKLQRRFQRHFPALSSESVISAHSCSMEKMNKEEHWVGRMYITDRHLCFQGKLDKYIAKVNVRYADVISVQSLRDGASAGSEEGGRAGPVVGVKVMSLVSKYSFSNFQHGHVPIQEIRAQWQATQSHAAALQQASQRRLDILMRPPSIVAPSEPVTSSSSYQSHSPPLIKSSDVTNSSLVHPPPSRPLPIPKPSPARSTTTLAAPSAATATAVLVAPEPKHSTQPSSGISVMTHPTGYNPGLSLSRPSTSSGSISNTASIPTLMGIAPIGGTPPVLNAPAAIVNGGALVVPAPSIPAPLPPVAQSNGNGSSSSTQLSAIPTMEATAGTAGTAFRGFFNRMVKSKRSESATGSGSMSTSNNAAVMAAAAAAVAAGPPASSSSSSTSLTKAGEKREIAPSTSSSDTALVAPNASAAAKPAVPSKPQKSYSSTCPCTSLTPLKHTVLAPILVPTSAKQVWLALFGPSAPVYQSAHKTRETERMDLPEWPAPNSNDVPVVGTQRTVSYRISFYLPLKGKQSADSTETQKVVTALPADGSTSPTAWIVEYLTKTPDVPSGGSFTTQARVCVNQVGPNKTSVHVQFAVNFHEKVRFIQGQIEQGGVDGCTALWKEIAQGLKDLPLDAEDLESAAVASAIGNGPSSVMKEPIVIEAPASEGPISSSVPGSAVGSPSKVGGSGGAGGPAARRQPLAVLNSGSVAVERLVRLVVGKPRKLKKYLLITAIIMTLVNALYAVWLAGQVASLLPELSTGIRSMGQLGQLASPPSTAVPTATAPQKARETAAADASGAGQESSELAKAGGQKDAAAILLDTWSKSLQARAETLQAELSALRAAAAVVGEGDSQKR